ncbi:flagellar assembly protein FliW [Paenibacillus kyungheensis]
MILKTTSWGDITIADEQIYQFTKGLPGFEEEKSFAWIDVENSPFSYLQSLQEPSLSFLLVDPFVVYPDYEFEIEDQEYPELVSEKSLRIACMVTLHDQMEKSTLNLLAPIVCNAETSKAEQIILHQSPYHTKHLLQPSDQKEGA